MDASIEDPVKRNLQRFFLFARICVAFVSLYFVVNLFTVDIDGIFSRDVPDGTVASLNWLSEELREGAGDEMQAVFPEGFVITHAIYGFSWVDIALRTKDSKLKDRALDEARWARDRIDTPEARSIFTRHGTIDGLHFGAFYHGYLNWLRGGILRADPSAPEKERKEFRQACEELAAALVAQTESPYLSSYQDMAWPGDTVYVVATLRLHDRLFEPRYTGLVDGWVEEVQKRLDEEVGLPAHRVDPYDGEAMQPARGVSSALVARMLAEIDPAFARQQYLQMRRHFVDQHLGIMVGLREHRKGINRPGDIDSGPLILGYTASGTVMAAAAARLFGDRELGEPLFQGLQAAGFPIRLPETRRYALGLLPVGDAFLVWAQTTVPWTFDELPRVEAEPVVLDAYRAVWILLWLVYVALLFTPEFIGTVKRRRDGGRPEHG